MQDAPRAERNSQHSFSEHFLLTQEKLNQKNQFISVNRQGRSLKSDYFIIKYIRNDSGVITYAVSARKKIIKSAVKRNYAKRRLRHLFRDYPPKHAGMYIIYATALTITARFEDIKNDFIKNINKIK